MTGKQHATEIGKGKSVRGDRQGNSLSALNKLARGMTEDYTERRTQQDVQVTDTINAKFTSWIYSVVQ
jgi:hypothetical protein